MSSGKPVRAYSRDGVYMNRRKDPETGEYLPEGRWYGTFKIAGEKVRKSLGIKSDIKGPGYKQGEKQAIREHRRLLLQGISKIDFAEIEIVRKAFLDYKKLEKKSSNTLSAYEKATQLFVNYLQSRNIMRTEQITPKTILEYRRHLEETPLEDGSDRNEGGVKFQLRHIKTFIGYLLEHNHVDGNYTLSGNNGFFKGIDLKQRGTKTRTFDYGEEEAIIESSESYELLFRFMFATGRRENEVIHLRWEWLSFGEDEVEMTFPKTITKCRRDQSFVAPETVVEILNEAEARCKRYGLPTEGNALVFPTKTGNPVARNNLWGATTKALKKHAKSTKQEYNHGSPHDIRRTVVDRLIEVGTSPFDLMDITGHTNYDIVKEFYAKMNPKRTKDAIVKMAALREAKLSGSGG